MNGHVVFSCLLLCAISVAPQFYGGQHFPQNFFSPQQFFAPQNYLDRQPYMQPLSAPQQVLGPPQYSLAKDPRFILFLPSNFFSPTATCTVKNSVRTGTCMGLLKCMFTKGSIQGFCGGFGGKACCDYLITGTGTLRFIRGGWVNKNPPGPSTLTIQRANSFYTQVRLDFRTLLLDQPNAESVCVTTTLTVTGQLGPLTTITLCGDLSDQHIYLNFNAATNIVATIIPSATSRWEIEITQLMTTDRLFAPTNCLQYHLEPAGTIESFNYGTTTAGTRQIANLDYLVCIKMEPTLCSITLTNVGLFSVTGDGTPGAAAVVPPPTDCLTDFLGFSSLSFYIDGLPVQDATAFCGNSFPVGASIRDTLGVVGPAIITMRVVTNGAETAVAPLVSDVLNVGWNFAYTTSPSCVVP